MLKIGSSDVSKIQVGTDNVSKIVLGTSGQVWPSGGSDSLEQLQADMNLTDYARLSLTAGDMLKMSDRYFTKGDVPQPFIGLQAHSTAQYYGYGALYISSSGISGTSTAWGGLVSSGSYTTANGSTVYLYVMEGMYSYGDVLLDFSNAYLLLGGFTDTRPYIISSTISCLYAAKVQELESFIDRYVALMS